MVDFSGLFQTQGMLLIIMLLGFLLSKIKILKSSARGLLSDLVLYVTLPATILESFLIEFNRQILVNCLGIFIASVLIQAGTYLLGLILYRKEPADRRSVLRYATSCSNAGILGMPIAQGVFGELGILYASMYLIPQRIFMWSVGLSYFTKGESKGEMVKKVITHPCILAAAVGLILMIAQIPLPALLTTTISSISSANTFLAMLLVGSILSEIRFRQLLDLRVFVYSLIRLFFIPLLVFIICRLVHVEALVAGVAVVLTAMPAASVTAILADKYDGDSVFATKCVVLSTLLSVVTIPIWCIFLA